MLAPDRASRRAPPDGEAVDDPPLGGRVTQQIEMEDE